MNFQLNYLKNNFPFNFCQQFHKEMLILQVE